MTEIEELKANGDLSLFNDEILSQEYEDLEVLIYQFRNRETVDRVPTPANDENLPHILEQRQLALPSIFDAVSYWKDKRIKKWVVTVTDGQQIDTLFVASASEQGAKRHAKSNTTLTGRLRISARLAHPEDLCAVHNSSTETMWI